MACNCKVTQNIDYLHKKYGDKTPQSKASNIRGSAMAIIENAVIFTVLLPLTPFMLVFAIGAAIAGKTIHLDKIVKRT
jgi:hypothetical protein